MWSKESSYTWEECGLGEVGGLRGDDGLVRVAGIRGVGGLEEVGGLREENEQGRHLWLTV